MNDPRITAYALNELHGAEREKFETDLARDTGIQSGLQEESTETDAESLTELTVPGEPHELLAGTVGEWDLTIRTWSSPDAEPVESKGTASGRWILGERFVETTYQGEVMGRAFEALKIEGYEKATPA